MRPSLWALRPQHRDAAADLAVRLATVHDALLDATLRAELAEAALERRDGQIEKLRAELESRTARTNDMEKRLTFGDEHALLLSREANALHAGAKTATAELERLNAELFVARERAEALEAENRRVRREGDEQAALLVQLAERHGELEAAVERERQGRSALEAQHAARALEDQQSLRTELDARCEALANTIADRDAALEQLNADNKDLADQLEQAALHQARALRDLELLNQKYLDDLQRERSERTLVQLALEIARGSREALEKRHDALRRAGRGWRDDTGGSEGAGEADASAPSNVRRLGAAAK